MVINTGCVLHPVRLPAARLLLGSRSLLDIICLEKLICRRTSSSLRASFDRGHFFGSICSAELGQADVIFAEITASH